MKFHVSHLVFDWATVLGALLLFLLLEHKIDPFHRMFSISDPTIQFPYAKTERVPVWLLFVISYAVPASVIAGWSVIMSRGWRIIHLSILGLTASTALTVFATALIKNGVGRPRPDMLDRCQPAADTPANTLVTIAVCTTTDSHFINEGFRSFPSGHSSYAFAGLGFLAFWMSGQLCLFQAPPRSWKSFVCFAPLVGAALVAVTRTEDYRHHWHDVTIGGILGFVIAYFAYRQYFPALHSTTCGVPHEEQAIYSDVRPNDRTQPEFQVPAPSANASQTKSEQLTMFSIILGALCISSSLLSSVLARKGRSGYSGGSIPKAPTEDNTAHVMPASVIQRPGFNRNTAVTGLTGADSSPVKYRPDTYSFKDGKTTECFSTTLPAPQPMTDQKISVEASVGRDVEQWGIRDTCNDAPCADYVVADKTGKQRHLTFEDLTDGHKYYVCFSDNAHPATKENPVEVSIWFVINRQ